jgi:hypothetical protein
VAKLPVIAVGDNLRDRPNLNRSDAMPLHLWQILGGTAILSAVTGCARAPDQAPYAVTVDVVECHAAYERECLHFYEQNWKVFREEALVRGFISGYHLLQAEADSMFAVTLLLMTEYPDSVTFARVEDNFQPMMRELRPDGLELLNEVPRSEFVANRTGYTARSLASR